MSIEVMTAVWDYSTAYGGDLLIMLAVANYADVNGRAYPSIRTLAQRGRMTERNAQYCIRKLEAMGELKVERNAGPHGVHVFQVLLRDENNSGVQSFQRCKVFTHQKKRSRNKDLTSETGEKFAGVQTVQTETHFTGGVKPISPEPSLDPSVKEEKTKEENPPISPPGGDVDGPSQKPTRQRAPKKPKDIPTFDPEGYAHFIEAYPIHDNWDAIVAAWDWLKPPADVQRIILADIENRKTNHRRWAEGYIIAAAKYLKERRWRDDIIPLSSPKPPAFKAGPTQAGPQEWALNRKRQREMNS